MLIDQGACGSDLAIFEATVDDGIELTRAAVEDWRRRGGDVLWAGVRLMSAAGRLTFVTATLDVRRPFIKTIIGRAPPAGAQAKIDLVTQIGTKMGDVRSRLKSRVLRDLARDESFADPDCDDAYNATLAVLRAASYATGDQEKARTALIERAAEILGIGE